MTQKAAQFPKAALIIIPLILAGISFRIYSLRQPFVYVGTLEATQVDLSARVPSTIAAVTVDEGMKIKEGQILLRLGCEDIKIASKLANQNFERAQKLFRVGSMPQEAFDQASNHKEDADLKMSWCEIHSPINGTVLARYHEPGEWMSTGTRILSVANIRDIWAYLYVPQPLIAQLSTGMKLTGHLPELDNKAFEGQIAWISDQAEFTPKNVQTREERTRLVFAVKVRFDNPDEILKPGMSIEVRLPDYVLH